VIELIVACAWWTVIIMLLTAIVVDLRYLWRMR